MTVQLPKDFDDMMASLRQEFVIDAGDVLENLYAQLDTVRAGTADDPAEVLKTVLRETHSLKGQGSSFDLPSLSLVAHRLENYLDGVETLEAHHVADAQRFITAMTEVIEDGSDPGNEVCSRILRDLPAKGSAKGDFEPSRNYEVILIASTSVLAHAIEQVLNSRGLRVITLRSPIDAFETAIRCRPDLIIASAMMEGISGVDLARAFASMAPTRDIPFALLTSFERTSAELRDLPEAVPTIRHDQDIDGEIGQLIGTLEKEG